MHGVMAFARGVMAFVHCAGYLPLIINCMQELENLGISLSKENYFLDTSHNNMNVRHYLLQLEVNSVFFNSNLMQVNGNFLS